MPKAKEIVKSKKRMFFLFCAVVVFTFFTWSIWAQDVPQKIGFKDVELSSLTRTSCVDCHGASLVDTHHETKPATSGDCISCHSVSKKSGSVGVEVERNCMKCHSKSPHHRTEAAKNNECTSCHESPGVSDYSLGVPAYKVSNLTPTVASCQKCHHEGVFEGQKIVGMKKTHHGIGLEGCNTCHDEKDKKNTSIRICQRCHSVKALHEVLPHVKKDNCVQCHTGKKKV